MDEAVKKASNFLEQITEEVENNDSGSESISQATSNLNEEQLKMLQMGKKTRQRRDIVSMSIQLSQSKSVFREQEFAKVLRVKSCESKDLAVNYDIQMKQQVDYFKKKSLMEKDQENIRVSFNRKSKAMIEDLNLNQTSTGNRHYYQNQKYKEFIVYSIEFANMKRILTLRTQYLLVNQTMFDYDVKIISGFDRSNFEVKVLTTGQSIPIPESYNQSFMCLKLRQLSNSSWSDEWPIYALKKIVQVDQPGYLNHGQSFTFFRKESGPYSETFDICLMPPVVVKNCLPCELKISFSDSNRQIQKIQLLKEETRNLFGFNLQEQIKLQIQIENYSKAHLKLDNNVEIKDSQKFPLVFTDGANRKVTIYASISQKKAGYKICFFAAHCLVNTTGQNLLFFYKEPSRDKHIYDADREFMVSQPLESSLIQKDLMFQRQQMAVNSSKNPNLDSHATLQQQAAGLNGIQSNEVQILTASKQIYAKIEGSADISDQIQVYLAGSRNKFQLVQRNKLLEFGYFTDLHKASQDEAIYTKVTTIQPLYLFVNYTSQTLVIAQESVKGNPLMVRPGQQASFYWSDKDSEKKVVVCLIPSSKGKHAPTHAYDWSIGFSLAEPGSLTIQNREKKDEHFLNRQVQNQSAAGNNTSHQNKTNQTTPSQTTNDISGFFSDLFSSSSGQNQEPKADLMTPVCKSKKKLMRVSRTLNRQQMMVIIEDEEEELPELRIENRCSNISLLYQQTGNKLQTEIDVCEAESAQAFCWTNPKGEKSLEVEFVKGKRYYYSPQNEGDIVREETSFRGQSGSSRKTGDKKARQNERLKVCYGPTDKPNSTFNRIQIPMDKFSLQKREVKFQNMHRNTFLPVYMSMYTDGFTKTVSFDNIPPEIKEEEDEEGSIVIIEEGRKKTLQKVLTSVKAQISMLGLSICQKGTELLTFHIKGLSVDFKKRQKNMSIDLCLQSLQIDNQSESNPIYPVVLHPCDIRTLIDQDFLARNEKKSETVDDLLIPKDVFQLQLGIRSDVPNVIYFENIAFLLQRLDLKLELAHVVILTEFASRVTNIFKKNLVNQHIIFQNKEPDYFQIISQANNASASSSLVSVMNTPNPDKQAKESLLEAQQEANDVDTINSMDYQEDSSPESPSFPPNHENSSKVAFSKEGFEVIQISEFPQKDEQASGGKEFGENLVDEAQDVLSEAQKKRQQRKTLAENIRIAQMKLESGHNLEVQQNSDSESEEEKLSDFSPAKQKKQYDGDSDIISLPKIKRAQTGMKDQKRKFTLGQQGNSTVKNYRRHEKENQGTAVVQRKGGNNVVQYDQLMKFGLKRIYIEKYRGSPLAVRISLIKQGKISEKEMDDLAFYRAITNLGLTITSLENAPLEINALQIDNVYGDKTEVVTQFKGYYKQQLKNNTLAFVGASNLLGNPVSFLDTIGSGITDFYYEPANGFSKGIKEGSIGLVKGTKSLVKNTFVGSVGSIGKVSSSMGSVMLQLTGDDTFIENRNRFMIQKRPEGIMSGLEQGFGSALKSGWSGIAGVVNKPAEGLQKDGASGLFKGTLAGVAGLIVKPVTGAMDLVSKASQGLEQASKTAEEKVREARLRPPRPFYGIDRVIRNYDVVHANLLLILPQLRYRLPELPDELLSLDLSCFCDAWILEEQTLNFEWSVLLVTRDQAIKLARFYNKQSLKEELKQNEKLRATHNGDSLIQVISVNSFSQLMSVELYENRMLDLIFEDSREIIHIQDRDVAEEICNKIGTLHKAILKTKKEQYESNPLLYRRDSQFKQKNVNLLRNSSNM